MKIAERSFIPIINAAFLRITGGEFEYCDTLGNEEEDKTGNPEEKSTWPCSGNNRNGIEINERRDQKKTKIEKTKNTGKSGFFVIQWLCVPPGLILYE